MKTPSLLWLTRGAIAIAGLAVTLSVQAAPATSEELSSASDQTGPASPSRVQDSSRVPVLPTGAGVQQSTTVELLLQLQDRPNLLGAESSKNAPETRRTAAPQGTGSTKANAGAESPADSGNPLLNLKEIVLGPAKPRSGDADSRDPEDGTGQAQRSTSDSGQPQRSAVRADSGEPRESLLSNPVVRFIRENRGLTISVSIAVLVAIWLTANFSMRRGR